MWRVSVQCLSTSHSHCHIHSFLFWILVIIIVYKSNIKVKNLNQPIFFHIDMLLIQQIVLIGIKDMKLWMWHWTDMLDRRIWQTQLEIVDQWSTRIPPPHRRGWHFSKSQAAILKWLLPTATKDMHMKFETEIRKQTWVTLLKHAIQKPRNLIWPPGSHLENEVTENQ